MFYSDECKHGQLSRSCELCEKEAEIKRLATLVKELKEGEEILKGVVERLSTTAEMQSTWIHENCGSSLEGLWITNEQIDAAWAIATGPEPDALDSLAELSIVACKECGGDGVWAMTGINKSCPVCAKYTGHGWIKEEHGDEHG